MAISSGNVDCPANGHGYKHMSIPSASTSFKVSLPQFLLHLNYNTGITIWHMNRFISHKAFYSDICIKMQQEKHTSLHRFLWDTLLWFVVVIMISTSFMSSCRNWRYSVWWRLRSSAENCCYGTAKNIRLLPFLIFWFLVLMYFSQFQLKSIFSKYFSLLVLLHFSRLFRSSS